MRGNWLYSAFRRLYSGNVQMNFERVWSKSISEIGYDVSSRTLGVVYNNGLVYTVSDFPRSKFEKLRKADFDREFSKVELANFVLIRRGRWAPLIR